MVSERQSVSKYETSAKTGSPGVGGYLAARLRENGWSVRDAADYLGVSRQRLYSVFADPRRARLWECAVAGLPVCTDEIKLALKTERDRKPKPLPRVKIKAPGMEVNDIVICSKYAGIAEEGEEGWIAGLTGKKDALKVMVKMPGGEDWFPLKDFHEYFVTNGLTRTP